MDFGMQVGMVFNETLRLFPPATAFTRVATKDLQLKELFVPKGMTIEFTVAAIHQDRDYWVTMLESSIPADLPTVCRKLVLTGKRFFLSAWGQSFALGTTSQ